MDIARYHELPVWKVGAAGVLLGTRHDYVLLPAEEAPEGVAPGDVLRVFVTTDTEDVRTATLRTPAGESGDVVAVRVVGKNAHGVFVDWGLAKDLFVPWKHQYRRLDLGDLAVVYITVDHDTDRPIGFTKLVDLLSTDTRRAWVGDEVQLVVYGTNEVGVLCVVNDCWSGLLYRDELGDARPQVGDRLTGYVTRIRETGKLDVSLAPVGRAGIDHAMTVVLDALVAAGGALPLTDRSPPETIRGRLGLSKKQFKKAVGALYKQRRIVLEEDGIRQV